MHLQIVHNTLTNFLRLDFKPAQGKISERPRKQVKSATSRLLHRLFILWVFVYLAENDVIMTSWKLARAQIRTQDTFVFCAGREVQRTQINKTIAIKTNPLLQGEFLMSVGGN